MSGQFADIIEKLNREPLEKQVNVLHKVVFEMTDLIQNLVDNFTTEISNIHNTINSIEAKQMITAVSNPQKPTSPKKLNQPKPLGKEMVRSAIMGELKAFFNKSNNKEINEKGSE